MPPVTSRWPSAGSIPRHIPTCQRTCSFQARSSSSSRQTVRQGGRITQWWQYVAGANWRQPTGPGSSIDGKGKSPGRARRLRGRARLRALARPQPADGGAMGVRRARWPRWRGRLVERVRCRRQADREHLAGHLPGAEHQGRRLRRNRAGRVLQSRTATASTT